MKTFSYLSHYLAGSKSRKAECSWRCIRWLNLRQKCILTDSPISLWWTTGLSGPLFDCLNINGSTTTVCTLWKNWPWHSTEALTRTHLSRHHLIFSVLPDKHASLFWGEFYFLTCFTLTIYNLPSFTLTSTYFLSLFTFPLDELPFWFISFHFRILG
jgi:hypothetical protein